MLDPPSDHPDDCSFEIEPAKLRSNESLETNLSLVFDVVQRFLGYLVETVDSLPKWEISSFSWSVLPSLLGGLCVLFRSIRQVCHHIAETVSKTWPESKYPALGAFFFLRLACIPLDILFLLTLCCCFLQIPLSVHRRTRKRQYHRIWIQHQRSTRVSHHCENPAKHVESDSVRTRRESWAD